MNKATFCNVEEAHFFQIGDFCTGNHIFKSYRIVCWLGEVEALLDMPGCFEHSLLKHYALWRSQPDDLVPLSKFEIIIIIHFFRNRLFSQSIVTKICIAGLNRRAGYATDYALIGFVEIGATGPRM